MCMMQLFGRRIRAGSRAIQTLDGSYEESWGATRECGVVFVCDPPVRVQCMKLGIATRILRAHIAFSLAVYPTG